MRTWLKGTLSPHHGLQVVDGWQDGGWSLLQSAPTQSTRQQAPLQPMLHLSLPTPHPAPQTNTSQTVGWLTSSRATNRLFGTSKTLHLCAFGLLYADLFLTALTHVLTPPLYKCVYIQLCFFFVFIYNYSPQDYFLAFFALSDSDSKETDRTWGRERGTTSKKGHQLEPNQQRLICSHAVYTINIWLPRRSIFLLFLFKKINKWWKKLFLMYCFISEGFWPVLYVAFNQMWIHPFISNS